MNEEDNIQNMESTVVRPEHRRLRSSDRDRFFLLRNVLNIIFMIGAVVGVIVYLTASDTTMGTIIVLAAMMFKIAECCIRFIR